MFPCAQTWSPFVWHRNTFACGFLITLRSFMTTLQNELFLLIVVEHTIDFTQSFCHIHVCPENKFQSRVVFGPRSGYIITMLTFTTLDVPVLEKKVRISRFLLCQLMKQVRHLATVRAKGLFADLKRTVPGVHCFRKL